MKLLLKNATFYNYNGSGTANILIENEIIESMNADANTPADRVIDCAGKIVVPGLIDMHVHFRDPGLEYKEDIVSGSEAAVAGGVTTVCPMANTKPVNDNAFITRFMVDRAEEIGLVDLFPVGAITKGLAGEELTEMGDMLNAGAIAFSDDGKPVMSAEVMRRALEYASQFGSFVISHAEDLTLAGSGVMNDGEISTITGLRGIPAEAEEVMIARDILLAKQTGGHVHIAHVSTKGSVELIRWGKEQGIKVTAEAAPHHFVLTEKELLGYNTNYKMNPPLRTSEDVRAIRDALKSGILDCIATDHAPHHIDEKFVEFDLAANGITGLQTLIPLTIQMMEEEQMGWSDFVRLTSFAPAQVLGLDDRGELAAGKLADITVIDPADEYLLDRAAIKSKSTNTPYFNKALKGRAVATIKSGHIVYTI